MASSSGMFFESFGRSYHLRVATSADLQHVLDLNDAHWVATGAPVTSINLDPVFLKLIDNDGNGRILCYEIREAIRWLLDVLKDNSAIDGAANVLALDSINAEAQDGQRILVAARKILGQLRASDTGKITLDQVRAIKKAAESTPVSEAGVVLPGATDDAELSRFLADIVKTTGGSAHPSNSPGVAEQQLALFIEQARSYLDWCDRGRVATPEDRTDVCPLGANTSTAFLLYKELRQKLDDYFQQCRLVAFDKRSSDCFRLTDAQLTQMDSSSGEAIEEVLKKAPIAVPRSDRVLSFGQQVNIYYNPALEVFREKVAEPALRRPAHILSETEWQEIKDLFAPHEQWLKAKPDSAVEQLGDKMLRTYLDARFEKEVRRLIADSVKTAVVLDNIRLAEKLILYQANIITLVNNFVSFPHLYHPAQRAAFEMGSLVADGRRFNFSTKVDNRAEHSALAKTSNICVLYAEISPGGGLPKYTVAIPVTSGSKGNLCLGKRGVFMDLQGEQSDARIVEIIENPISLTEALLSPFQRLGKMLTGRIEAIASSAEKKFDDAASKVVNQPGALAAPAPSQSKGAMAGGLLMGGGVAIAALGSSLAYITRTLANVSAYKILISVVVAILAVMAPLSLMAISKLRRRDLSSILEGAGWAINARMRLSMQQGMIFTQTPRYPTDAGGIRGNRFVVLLSVAIVSELIYILWRLKL